jgi:hypothetical protein
VVRGKCDSTHVAIIELTYTVINELVVFGMVCMPELTFSEDKLRGQGKVSCGFDFELWDKNQSPANDHKRDVY